MLMFFLIIMLALVPQAVDTPPDGPIIMDPPKVRVGDDPRAGEFTTEDDGKTVRVWIRNGRGWYESNGVYMMLDADQYEYVAAHRPGAHVRRVL